MLMKVMDVYELEGAPKNFAFYAHGQGHSVPYEARQLIYGWLDKHLKGEDVTRCRSSRTTGSPIWASPRRPPKAGESSRAGQERTQLAVAASST